MLEGSTSPGGEIGSARHRSGDRRGHPTGDAVLVAFARLVRSTIRLKGCFARVGGEEFLIVLPAVERQDGRRRMEALLDAIRRCRPLPHRPDLTYRCSSGLVGFEPGDAARSLYAGADRALYAAKSGDRDRIVVL